ncbi:hypothetical protein DPMN_000148 [Dreissena polymorpha]|uniref:Uncharacterized protein n=1 Tax=Dreissena polymorpha TaxID=45954 RepID=A0A9D4MIF4_DREPO|nr:hypothetical protein DPMN_000148 [Dreissena polymorpha]
MSLLRRLRLYGIPTTSLTERRKTLDFGDYFEHVQSAIFGVLTASLRVLTASLRCLWRPHCDLGRRKDAPAVHHGTAEQRVVERRDLIRGKRSLPQKRSYKECGRQGPDINCARTDGRTDGRTDEAAAKCSPNNFGGA